MILTNAFFFNSPVPRLRPCRLIHLYQQLARYFFGAASGSRWAQPVEHASVLAMLASEICRFMAILAPDACINMLDDGA